MTTLRSERLALRPLGVADARFVEGLYASPDVTRTLLRIQRPISSQGARALCETPSTVSGEHRFVAALQAGDQPIGLGTVRIPTAPHRVATIGYSVLPAFWSRGLATEMAGCLVEFAFGTLAAQEARATTLDGNPASARVLEKVGFEVLKAGAREVDSRGVERLITRWCLRRPRDAGGDSVAG